MDGRTFFVEIDGVEYKDALLAIDISMDIFVNEDGREIGRVPNKGIRTQKKERKERDITLADLEVDLAFDRGQANENDVITFTITAKNNGPNKAIGAYVTNALPDGYAFISATPSVGTWADEQWTVGDLEVNQTATLVMRATVLNSGNYVNEVQIHSTDTYDRFPTNDMEKTGNRVFVMKTKDKTFDSGAKGANLSGRDVRDTETFITTNLQRPEMFTADCLAYRNTVEITPKESTRQAMVNVVIRDDGSGGTFDVKPDNNKEYGGAINKDGEVYNISEGALIDLSKATYASVSITHNVGDSIFHSHPSGSLGEEKKNTGTSASTSVPGFGGGEETKQYGHAPSNVFDDGHGHKMGDVFFADNTIRYVFARKSPQKVYIYNDAGVLATLPHQYFVNFRR
ncbi:DUF11 domain-containing protein [Epilithonimonas hungarica]|uniref:Conserved repeat domain-containing protein n=1 Tax=Epilithonimonas hungarica TaxID=454006 RepID=A0A1G7W1N2_9FLAO|nr:DUF11 domain-containing protein [Epilithonimonas hungarica]SDG65050.1 conserved repeat domain-containing protein [Epilithonimonas hungarica]